MTRSEIDSGAESPLCRDDLAAGSERFARMRAQMAGLMWTDDQLNASLARTLRRRPPGDVWLFAYGSLIWNPLFPVAEERVARVHGLHRAFCIWTRIGRGTPERPGLVLGLDAGGSCQGVVLRLASHLVQAELALVWRREMLTGAYRPTWVRAQTEHGIVDAIAFVANRRGASYAGRLPEADVVRIMGDARGLLGTCAGYLRQTSEGLSARGIRDAALRRLLTRIDAA